MTDYFSDLVQRIETCTICADILPYPPRPIVQIHPDTKVLIVGQAPGRRVYESGIPFDDPSGDRLRRWMDVDKLEFYDAARISILPMGFCYPGTGKSGDLPPRPECARSWRQETLAALAKVELTIVVGSYALKYHIPDAKTNLTQTVANWEIYWPKIIPLPHPSPRNIAWFKRNAWFEAEVVPKLQERVKQLINRD